MRSPEMKLPSSIQLYIEEIREYAREYGLDFFETVFEVATIRVSVQDVRTWASETGTLTDFSADNLDLHEAWAEVGFDRARLKRGLAFFWLGASRPTGSRTTAFA